MNSKTAAINNTPSDYLIALNDSITILDKADTEIPFQEFLNIIMPLSSADSAFILLNHSIFKQFSEIIKSNLRQLLV